VSDFAGSYLTNNYLVSSLLLFLRDSINLGSLYSLQEDDLCQFVMLGLSRSSTTAEQPSKSHFVPRQEGASTDIISSISTSMHIPM
jgi:hypothetical protein